MLFLKKYTLVKLWAHLVSTNVLVLQQNCFSCIVVFSLLERDLILISAQNVCAERENVSAVKAIVGQL